MPSLNLFTSNRLEILVQELAAVLQAPLGHPLQKEIIVVQSKGMERWVSLQLARLQGICANVRFPFPSRFIADAFRAVIPDLPGKENAYDPAVMTWEIMRLLPPLLQQDGFQLLRRYLDGPDNDLRLFQLSSRIAGTFDHYLLFRPDMILNWEAGKESHWQAQLWRALAADKGGMHPAALQRVFLNRLREGKADLSTLPQRIAVFGISALPPFHVQVMAAVSSFIDVNLFLLNPCREYWGDIVSDREIERITSRRRNRVPAHEDLYLEKGNSLLSSWGIQGRDFFESIAGQNGLQEHPVFEDPGEATLLAAIQSDILNLRDGKESRATVFPFPDSSLQVHSCHSPLREMEVLQDQLLALFEADPTLKPSDILVMTPNIGLYAPFVQAVFALPKEDPRWMPFTIADRGLRQASVLADHFLKLLDLTEGRLGASQVFDFLESPAVRDRFALSEDDLEVVHTWIEASGIRWGLDADSRAAMDLPADPQNTWRLGLDRMLLGYALPASDADRLFQGLLPLGGIEGSDTVILERFLAFTERLFVTIGELSRPRTLAEWSDYGSVLLETFFAVDQDVYDRDARAIRQILNDLSVTAESSSYMDPLPLDVIKAWLADQLEARSVGQGFLAGGVTFCAMLPMRSIPFDVLCLVGMDDGAYPRESPTLTFDLMARHPRPGDRSRRGDDRYLFLEALVSARKTFYISYVGQAIDDNSIRPPSVLVSELMDYIEEAFGRPGHDIREGVVTRHALQAFNPGYFKRDGRLFSYSDDNYQAARQLMLPRRERLPFIASALPEPEEEWREIDLDDLCRFFRNPSRYLLIRRLGLHLGLQALTLEENEPFTIEGLDQYDLRVNLAAKAQVESDLRHLHPLLSASGRLPHGAPGEYTYYQISRSVMDFVEILKPYISDGPRNPVDIDLTLGSFRLTGRIDGLYDAGPVFSRPAKVKAGDYLRAWIHHLTLNASGLISPSLLIFADYQGRYIPVENSGQMLEALLNIYFKGLSYPIRIFPNTSWVYASQIAAGKDEANALRAARNQWNGFMFPEQDDPAYRICFGQEDPLDEEFKRLAMTVIGPILRHLEGLP